MTRERAAQIIRAIQCEELPLHRAEHIWDSKSKHGLKLQDMYAVLRSHRMEAAPKWNREHENYEVALCGKCLEGRPVRLVLGLREKGPCRLITIMVIN